MFRKGDGEMSEDMKRLIRLLKEAQGKDRSLRRFAEEAGVSPSYLSRLLRGIRTDPPSPVILQRIAGAARNGVTYTDLLEAAGYVTDRAVEEIIKKWRMEIPFRRDEHLYVVPLLKSVPAGVPIDRIEDIEGYVPVDPLVLSGAEGFALPVKDNSMSGDRIFAGDIVIVRRQDTIEPEDVAVVVVDDHEAILRHIVITGGSAVLISSGPDFDVATAPVERLKVIGRVVEVRFRLPGKRRK